MTIRLNKNLLIEQGVNHKAEDAIKAIHKVLQSVLSSPKSYGKPSNAVAIVEHLEYTLQSLWDFPLDSRFHRYWFEVDDCLCPKMDNMDLIGTGYKVYNGQCKYHGAMLKQSEKECKLMEGMII